MVTAPASIKQKVFAIVFGQCALAMRQKLDSSPGHKKKPQMRQSLFVLVKVLVPAKAIKRDGECTCHIVVIVPCVQVAVTGDFKIGWCGE